MSLPKSARLLMPLALLLALTACQPKVAPVNTTAQNAALLLTAEGWAKAFNDKNADGIAALYAEDAQVFPPGEPVINGRAAIRDYFAADIARNAPALTLTTEASGVGGDWGWHSGTWSSASTPVMSGKFIEIWRRTSDGWRIHRDIWNNDVAPQH